MFLLLYIILTMATSLFAENNDEEVCRSYYCYYKAWEYFQSINNSIHPCDDFYSHVCSGWINKNKIPSKFDRWNWEKLTYETMKQYFNNTVLVLPHLTLKPLSMIERKMHNFHYSCLDTASKLGSIFKGLPELLAMYGGYPQIGIPLHPGYKWEEALATVNRDLDMEGIIFTLNVMTDVGSIKGDTAYFLKPSKNFIEQKNISVEEVLRYVAFFNISRVNDSYIRESTEKMIDFETSLRRIMDNATVGMNSNELYKATTVGEIHHLIGEKVNIKRYLINVLNGIVDIKNDTEIIVPYLYIRDIIKILEETDRETIANYIGFNVVKTFLDVAQIRFQENPHINETFDSVYCLNLVIQYFPLAVAHVYSNILNLKTPEQEELKKMFLELKKVYKDIINKTDWMDNVTKSTALKKIQKMSGNFLGPEMIQNETLLLEYYSMNISHTEFFYSLRSLMQLRNQEHINHDFYPRHKSHVWPFIITSAISVYNGYSNSVHVSVAMAMFPHFSRRLPLSVNFGGMGTALGHEITHGIQNYGLIFDEEGRYRYWWTDDSTEKFQEEANCLLTRYSNYSDPVTGVKLDADLSFPEDFADNAGLKVAYLAYKRYMQKCTGQCSLTLPGLNYTADQLFFVAYTFAGCSHYRTSAVEDIYRMSSYSPFRIRKTASLKNSEEFSRAFGCNSMSKMNFEEKCPIW